LIGIDPAASSIRVPITTGSGVENAARVSIDRVDALGRQRRQFSAIAHNIPASAGVDGVLGLDFLRRYRVTIDFRAGRIFLA
jgi:predicted aspartyl protease